MTLSASVFEVAASLEVEFAESIGGTRRGPLAELWSVPFERFCDRMLAFHGPGWQASPASPTVAAAIYPQAVALTRLLVSPYWQVLSAPGNPREELVVAELRRTVAPDYPWPLPFRSDPLETWIRKHYLSGYSPGLFGYHSWPGPGSLAHDATSARTAGDGASARAPR